MKLTLAIIAAASAGRIKDKSEIEKKAEKYEEKPLVGLDKEDPDYDHAAFVGEDEYKTFDDLTPTEAKEKLGYLIDKMDKNGDGNVDEQELTQWIHYVQTKYIYDDTERQWEDNDLDKDGKITWDEYKQHTYGFLSEEDLNKEEDDGFSYASMLVRDERRFKQADEKNKGYLDKDDLTAFLHPEEYDHMKEMVILETIEDIDKDQDGKISLAEYIGEKFYKDLFDDVSARKISGAEAIERLKRDMWLEEEDGEEPEWVEEERKQFSEFRDKDNSGYLEDAEVRDWILPSEYDHAEGEARHLIESADSNSDGILSKDEILDSHDVFVGSQATDWGDAIVRHDEF